MGRCGPEWGGRCNKDLVDSAVYCNIGNGWCGTTDDHKNAQEGDEYDWQPKSCKGKPGVKFIITTIFLISHFRLIHPTFRNILITF